MWWSPGRNAPDELRGRVRRWVGLSTALLILGSAGSAAGVSIDAHSSLDEHSIGWGDERVLDPLDLPTRLSLAQADPLGLIDGYEMNRYYGAGVDHLDVWLCSDVGQSLDEVVADLEAVAGAYLEHHSRGRYRPIFRPAGTRTSLGACESAAEQQHGPDTEGVLFVDAGSGGEAGPGYWCTSGDEILVCPDVRTWPSNARSGRIGWASQRHVVATHELGHMIHWPHTNTVGGDNTYDVANDVMSRNLGSSLPYGTSVINRYAAGWVDPDEVLVVDDEQRQIALSTASGDGFQMAVIPGGGTSAYVLGARLRSTWDDVPAAWEGVEVSRIDRCTDPCLGFRTVRPEPNVSSGTVGRDESLPHVIPAGGTRTVGGVRVEVGSEVADGFVVTFGEDGSSDPSTTTSPSTTVVTTPFPDPTTTLGAVTTTIPTTEDPPLGLRFVDIVESVFADDILWIADRDITRGCNPPSNDRFCPEARVTRGEMAAFLNRALYLPDGPTITFTDTAASVFAADIDRLATAGITRGCNPPANTRFCPGDAVTRGQMAAFLRRALEPLLPSTPGASFVDDDRSVFEDDIAWLAGAGITRGCNPPHNTRYCPEDPVTRAQMAAFLHRALE